MNSLYISDIGLSNTIQNPPIINNGLVGYWSFNENTGSTIFDLSGNNNNGLFLNSPTWVSGRKGRALNFNGINQGINLANNGVLNLTAAIGISCWVNITTNTPNSFARIIDKQYNSGFVLCHLSVSNQLIFGPNANFATSTTSLTANVWYHIGCTYDGLTVKIYVNGVLEGTTPFIGSIGNGSSTITFGYDNTTSPNAEFFTGMLDGVRIYNRALSQQEITTLYQIGF